jgi:multidrug efflux system membrane fusion protein
VAVSAAAFLAGCSRPAPPPPRRADAPVTVAQAVQKDVPVEIRAIGNVEAITSIGVKSLVGGELTAVHFGEGDFVRKGQLLFTIDQRPFQTQLSQAQAALARDRAQLAQAQANLARDVAQEKYAQAQAGRFGNLAREGVISREQNEQVASDAAARAATVNADRAAIESARAAIESDTALVENARIQFGYTTLRSPIDGRTGNLNVKAGNVVKANDVDMVTINQISPIYATFAVPESELAAIKTRAAAGRLSVAATPQDNPNAHETGVLTFIDNMVDRATGTIKLKGTFQNARRALWPGQFVQVVLRLATRANAVVVPSQALQNGQNGPYVFVVKSDRTVESRSVQPGIRAAGEVVIDSGLAPGETVVTEGHLRLAPGMRVEVRAPRAG